MEILIAGTVAVFLGLVVMLLRQRGRMLRQRRLQMIREKHRSREFLQGRLGRGERRGDRRQQGDRRQKIRFDTEGGDRRSGNDRRSNPTVRDL